MPCPYCKEEVDLDSATRIKWCFIGVMRRASLFKFHSMVQNPSAIEFWNSDDNDEESGDSQNAIDIDDVQE
jgi:hypothetical protein